MTVTHTPQAYIIRAPKGLPKRTCRVSGKGGRISYPQGISSVPNGTDIIEKPRLLSEPGLFF